MTQYDIYQFAKIQQVFIAMSGLSKVKLLCYQAGTGYGGEARWSELPVTVQFRTSPGDILRNYRAAAITPFVISCFT